MTMRPKTRTCFRILEIPRHYFLSNQLKGNLDFFLNRSISWKLEDWKVVFVLLSYKISWNYVRKNYYETLALWVLSTAFPFPFHGHRKWNLTTLHPVLLRVRTMQIFRFRRNWQMFSYISLRTLGLNWYSCQFNRAPATSSDCQFMIWNKSDSNTNLNQAKQNPS